MVAKILVAVLLLSLANLTDVALAEGPESAHDLRASSRLVVKYRTGASGLTASGGVVGHGMVTNTEVRLMPGQSLGGRMRTVLLSDASSAESQLIADQLAEDPRIEWVVADEFLRVIEDQPIVLPPNHVDAVGSATDGKLDAAGRVVSLSLTNSDGTATKSSVFTYVESVAPAITSVSPSAGPTAGGNSLTVTGTEMDNVTDATVGGNEATIVSTTPTSVTIVAPPGVAGSTAVSVTNPVGVAEKASAYRYVSAPSVITISVATGSTSGGQSVEFTGEKLSDVTAVTFGGTAAAITSKTETSLVVVTPARPSGTVDVTANGLGGTSTLASAFTYSAPATISTVSPASASTLGGAAVTITGTNLDATSRVRMGGTAATIVSHSPTSLVVTSPAHLAGTGVVDVTTPSGSVAWNKSFAFVAPIAPTIKSLSPITGTTLGGTRITVTGNNLNQVATVQLGGTSVAILSASATTLTFVAPSHAAGPATLVMKNVTGSASKSSAFTFVAPTAPVVSMMVPSKGSEAGGTRVTFTGNSLGEVTEVKFGTEQASVVSQSATILVVDAPAHAVGTVSVTLKNAAATTTATTLFSYALLPILTSATPVVGPATGGTTVTISGANLGATTSVTFGGIAGSIVSRSNSEISVVTPAFIRGGSVPVVVVMPAGTATLASTFTYSLAPTIAKVAPKSGPASGGTVVTITGKNLTAVSSVLLGNDSVAMTSQTATSITFVSPSSSSADLHAVTVSGAGGSAVKLAAYTYIPNARPTKKTKGALAVVGLVQPELSTIRPRTPNPPQAKLARTPDHPAVDKMQGSGQVLGSSIGEFGIATDCSASSSVEPYHRCLSDSSYDAGISVDAEIIWTDAYIRASSPGTIVVDTVPYAVITDTGWLTWTDNFMEFDFDTNNDGIDNVIVAPMRRNASRNSPITAGVFDYNPSTGYSYRGTVCSATVTNKYGDHAAIIGTGNSWWQMSADWSCLFGNATSSVRFSNYLEDYWDYDYAPNYYSYLPSANLGSLGGPTLTGISPATGPRTGGTQVTITGSSLNDATSANFGGSAAAIVSKSASSLTVTTPAHSPGLVDVTVTTPSGSRTISSGFEYLAAIPIITTVTPDSGSLDGGTRVVVTGKNLGTVTSAMLGGEDATIVSYSATSLTFITPPAASESALPTDPRFLDGTLWGLSGTYGINAPEAWATSQGSSDVVVAVIDTGRTAHSDEGNLVSGYDFVSLDDTNSDGTPDTPLSANDGNGRDSDPSDPGDWVTSSESSGYSAGGFFEGCYPESSSWHGTHVAGTINGAANGLGIVGVAPNVAVEHVRALGKCGGYMSDIIAAITWSSGGTISGVPANTHPADVINMSLGGTDSCSSAMQSAIDGAVSRGTTIVVAAGNEGAPASTSSPANCRNVIAVAAVGSTGLRASFSNYGSVVDVAAPGVSILSNINTGLTGPVSGSYTSYSGTSMATPHVAGSVALIKSVYPAHTPAMIESLLKATAKPFGSTRCDSNISYSCGAGIVNVGAAVR